MKTIISKLTLLILTTTVANSGTILNEAACTAPNREGTAGGSGYVFNIPCTELEAMAGGIGDNGAFNPGPDICGWYNTPRGAPFVWDGPCGGSTVVAADPNE